MFGGGDKYVRPLRQPEAPVNGQFKAPIHDNWHNSGGFTYQPNPTHPKGHMGLDMRAPNGTPVYPLAPGVVSSVGTDPMGGNVVNVSHPGNLRTYYAHLSTVRVQKGDRVDFNTILGTVGTSGNASHGVPHLHLQVWKDGQITDPAHFFSVPKYTAVAPSEKAYSWVSDQAKDDAMAFNMKEHLSSRRNAFASEVNKLTKIADSYYEITKKL